MSDYDKIEREAEHSGIGPDYCHDGDEPEECTVCRSSEFTMKSLRLLLDVARATAPLTHKSGFRPLVNSRDEVQQVICALTALKEHCDD